jgi:Fungal Zn(2)-Cys(6) binuclear cluster domain
VQYIPDYYCNGCSHEHQRLPPKLDFVNTASFWLAYPVLQQWFLHNIVSQIPLLAATRHEMMSLTSYGEHGQSINVNLRNTGFNSPSDIVPSAPDLQSTARSLSSHRQALIPTRAHSAPAKDPNHVVKTNLSDTASKRTHVKRDRSRMKCTRCVMHKRGCDGGRPQCENCRRSNMKCEWVGGEVTR